MWSQLGWTSNFTHCITKLTLDCSINFTRCTHAHHVPHTEHAFTGQQATWQIVKYSALESPYCNVMLSSAYPQVLTHKSPPVTYPVIFHPIIDQLTIFYISGLILLSSESSVAILMSPWGAHAKEVRKLCINLGLMLKHSAIMPQEINYPVTWLGNVSNVECMHGILVMR